MAAIGGLASLLLGSKPLSDYKPLSDKILKKLRTDTVRDKLCSAIGKSVYYYQGLLRVIRDLIHLKVYREGIAGQNGEMFDALLHEATDKTIFNIFSKIYSYKAKGILTDLESIRNSVMHSNYWVSEYSVWAEKPRLDKTENKELFKKDMNLNTDIIMSFIRVIIDTTELIDKIYLSEFKQEKDKKQESEQITTNLESLKSKIKVLKSNMSKTSKNKSRTDELIKALMYGI